MSLQYADDTILFLQNNIPKAIHFKWLLTCFEKLSVMKIYYNKSHLITLGVPEELKVKLARLFCCNIGELPIKYLGVPLHYNRLKRE